MFTKNEFIEIFQLPPAMVPYIDLLVTQQEMDLVVALGRQPLRLAQIIESMQLSQQETEELVRRALKRDLISVQTINGEKVYSPSSFYANLDQLTTLETSTWRRLPSSTRNQVAEWQIQEFIDLWRPAIEQFVEDPDVWVPMKNKDVLLLEEALELVEAAKYICLLPCPCKTTLNPNSPVIEGSMRVGERARLTLERGQGRRLTVDEAKAHLIALDRMGIVHTGPHNWKEKDPNLEWISHGNCHPSYSFPFIAGMRLGLDKRYPRSHYLAEIDWDACSHCGMCTGRCPFDALYHDGAEISADGETIRQVHYDPDRCWGCGLCATTCPEGAIRMLPLKSNS